jgi:two-component system, OmpR family, sensor kinase
MSLRRRLLLGVGVVALVLVGSNVVLAATFERYLMNRVDEQLADTSARPVLRTRSQMGPGGQPAETLTDLFLGVADLATGTIVQFGAGLFDASPPAVGVAELAARATRPNAPIAPFTSASGDGEVRWRLAAVSAGGSGRTILVVGVDLADVDAALARARTVQIGASAAVLVALAAVTWWVVRLGIRPVVAMAATADEIAAGDLSRRVEPLDERTAAGRLARALNAMLGQIEAAFAERQRSEERVRRFAADASHELRTPLTSIRGYAELWEAGGLREPAQLDEAMRRLAEESQRMSALVDDLMLLARLDQGRELEREPVALDRLADDAVNDARVVSPGRPVHADLTAVTVIGDHAALRQVVANLVSNALVHTDPDVPVHVRVAPEAGGWVHLEVRDEGHGLEPDVAASVFERFSRADSSRSRSGRPSTGLGLAIVHSIVEAHGGRVWLQTAPGSGCRFVVALRAPTDLSPSSQPTPS